MFIHEKTGVTIHANLDESVISSTLRTQDLVQEFLDVIRDTAEYVQIIQTNNHDLRVIFEPFSENDERWDSEYMSYFLNEELFDVLDSYAPNGYYFGSHEGDESDFGYWKNENN